MRALRIVAGRRTLVDHVDLDIAPGETIGIVGESGSGKSLTARALLGVLPPGIHAQGTVRFEGESLLELGERGWRRFRGKRIGLMLQDPFTMLNPVVRVGAQITETLRDERGRPLRRGPSRQEAVRRLHEVGIRDPQVIDSYPFQLSGGMRQRVALAATLTSNPDVLVADEPSTALDVTTQREILELLRSVQRARDMALILITHDLRVAFSLCSRVHVLYAGRVLEVAPGEQLERQPLHPYSLGLLLSEPPVNRTLERLPMMEGSVPQAADAGRSCSFAPRCEWALPRCRTSAAPLVPVADDRWSACIRIDEISGALAARRSSPAETTTSRRSPRGARSVVAVNALSKSFRSRSGREAKALDGVSLVVGEGEGVGLVGESGSGKTTLARCLVGLERPDSGHVIIDGFEVPPRPDSRARRRLAGSVQIVFQDPYSSLNPVRTVAATLREAIGAYERQHPAHIGRATVGDLLERVGLPFTYADRKPLALSGGERQRVAIARALALRPKLIVCDEPVSALDVSVQAQILNLFASLRDELGVAYLFITHDLAVVRQVADRVYVLLRGKVVETGPAARVLDRPEDPYTVRLLESVPRVGGNWLGPPS